MRFKIYLASFPLTNDLEVGYGIINGEGVFSSIAVEKEIYACETAQICVGLHIGEIISLSESSDTSHYIFNPIKYFFLVHGYAVLLTIK